ncbi:hypothetical protein BKA65DRAFT_406055, partial [Rhexocercosporidium sp. MPI-PUGE-AT-0058]
ESRFKALPFYVAAFTNGLNPRYIWTNFYLDTVTFHDEDLCKLSCLDTPCIRQLIIKTNSAKYSHGEC